MSEKKVNVMLYGGKSIFSRKETPLSADITYCDAADECPLRKCGKCLLASRMGRCKCIHGRVETRRGYTSRAAKYSQFRNTYTEDPMYMALNKLQDRVFIMVIGDDVFLKLGMLGLDYDTENEWKERKGHVIGKGMFICDPWIGRDYVWVPKDALNVDFFEKACKYEPRALMCNVIASYQDKDVPMIVDALKNALPDMYDELIERCPELAERELDHRGRYAKTITLKDGSKIKDPLGNVFIKQGNVLVCENFTNSLVGISGNTALGAYVSMPIDACGYTKVDDNDWVSDDTEFR